MCLGCPCILVGKERNRIRKEYKIEGNPCTDCLTAEFCSCCAVCQHAQEETHQEELLEKHEKDAGGQRQDEGYRTNQTMVYG